jgi:acyl-CoA-binding protein
MEKFCEEQDTTEAISPKNNYPSQANDEPIVKPVSTASHFKQAESKHYCSQTECGQYKPVSNKSDPSEVEVTALPEIQTDNPPTQNTNSSNFDWTQTKMPILPKSIEAVNHAKIYAIFKQGTLDHAKNALSVFTEMESKKVIHSPTGLLISLSQSAQKGELTLPDNIPQVDLSKVPLTAAHLRYDPEQAEIDAQRIQDRVNRQAKAKKAAQAAEQVKQSTASQNSAETNSKAKQTEEDNFPSTGSLSSIMRHLHAKNKKYLKSLE